MAVIGVDLQPDELVLQKGRDFKWTFKNLDPVTREPEDFPAGDLYFEFDTSPVTVWEFLVVGPLATLKIESEQAALIADRTRWQLVFRADGEAAGGDPLALGTVRIQK